LISNFRFVVNVVFFLLGGSPASESYVPTYPDNFFCSLFIGSANKNKSCSHDIWGWNRLFRNVGSKFKGQGSPKRKTATHLYLSWWEDSQL